MKNLHLMSMNSGFNTYLIEEINAHFPPVDNLFVWKSAEKMPNHIENVVHDAKWFSPDFINLHHAEWDQIFLHELFLTDRQILLLSDEAARKITWVVWGHDLYRKIPKPAKNIRSIAIFFYRWLRQNSIFFYGFQNKVTSKISKFRRIATGYSYDEVYIRKKFGNTVPVVYGPYFSKNNSRSQADIYREMHQSNIHTNTNILLGHCGAKFIQHEKYLRKLSSYKTENIHIFLVMSYLATPKRLSKIKKLLKDLFSEDQYTILTEILPRNEYYAILSKIDIGIFPFRQQSGLGNTKRLAYMGVKLYFDPKGVLYKGFQDCGVQVYNCHKVGALPFSDFIQKPFLPPRDAPLFDAFDYDRNIQAWKHLLYD